MINKKGLELSINFIVILILTIIVFAGSIMMAGKVFTGINQLKSTMDTQTQERLESMILSSNEEVIIAFNKKEVTTGKPAIFGLGIINTLNSPKNFKINITNSTSIEKNGSISSFGPGWSYIHEHDVGIIKNNDFKKISLVVIPPSTSKSGVTYIFDVTVTYSDDPLTSTSIWYPYPANNPIKKIKVIVT